MANLFNMDGMLYKICSFISQIMTLTILWILFSLPIFTIGASTLSLFSVSTKLIANEDIYILTTFYEDFKINFKQGIILNFIMLIFGMGALVSCLTILININRDWFSLLTASIVVLELIGLCLFITYLMAHYNMKIFSIIKNAFFISNLHLAKVFIGVIMLFVLGVVCLKVPFIVFILGPGSFSYLWCFIIKDTVSAYE